MSDIIDINVGETIEEVTINVTDNLITVNINKVTGGGGGTQTLAETLDLGNVTGGENISISNGDAIILDNGSMLKKGTIDAGNGGSKGISQICGVGYEHKWEAGRLYIMNDGGTIIREVSHNLTYTPTATDDVTKGFVQNTRWILDNGDVYLCTDPTEDAAVWELVNTGITPTLQEVTDEGNTTTNDVKVNSLGLYSNDVVDYGYLSWTDDLGLSFKNHTTQEVFNVDKNSNSLSFINDNDFKAKIQSAISDNRFYQLPDADGTIALTSDIPAAQVNSDWNATSGVEEILNKPTIPDTSTFVPYTGATADVDLGEYELKAGQIELDTTPTGTAGVAVTRWNDTIGSSETTLKGGSVILKNGVDLVARVVNKVSPNTTLTKAQYQVVKVSGAQGQRLAVDLARANNDLNSADTLGIVTETISANQEGFIITVGQLEGINTTGSLQSETWADGDVLYLSPTTAGRITNIKPNGSTGHIVVLGYVEHAHITQGKIYVKIMNGWELDELHNVYISSVANNQGLVYETSTSLWKNKTIDKTFVGLENVDNTSDANKPVSSAQTTAINAKVADAITDGVTTIAPSQNAVFDALALKQNAFGYTPYRFTKTTEIVHTGVLTETILQTILIPANTFANGDFIMFSALISKLANIGNTTHNLKINTTNTLVGATLIAINGFNTSNFFNKFKREFVVNSGNIYGYSSSTSLANDQTQNGTAVTINTATYNLSADLYFFVTCSLSNILDTITYRGINFYKQ
jgi:nitrogen fixation protein